LFAAAVMSKTGTCFWIRDSDGSSTTYGAGDPCTGMTASTATLPQWPILPRASSSPSVSP
jgi:hypothetical protein